MGAFPFPISHFGSSGVPDPGTLKTNLVALWEFDEASGNLIDQHNSNDLDDTGTPTYGNTGIIDDAIGFDGSTDYFRETTSSNLYTPASAASYSIWFKSTGNADAVSHQIMGKFYNTTGHKILLITIVGSTHATLNNRFLFETWDSGNTPNIITYNGGGSDIWLNTWNNIICVRDGADNEFFLNGVSVATNTAGNGSGRQDTASYNWWAVGAAALGGSPGLYVDADIDQSGVWSKALSQAEIDYVVNAGVGNAYANWS